MTDPTPTTTPTPPEGLTDEQLLELMPEQFRADLATASRLAAQDAGPDTKPGVFRVILNTGAVAYARAAITAHEAARAQLPPDYIDPEQTGEDRKLLEAFYVACRAEGGTADEITLRGIRAAIAADRAARPAPTPEEIEATFRQWWAESYPHAPAGNHAVASHVAFALHLLGRGVQ